MAFHDELSDQLIQFIGEQKIYFTATAPDSGRINLSPKGMDTFRCFGNRLVGYLDLTGSGNETAAHIAQNGRMTLMFCSFGEKPLILRLYGRGEIAPRDSPRWNELIDHFPRLSGERQLILLHVDSVQTSCGFAVPVYDFVAERRTLVEWAEKKGAAGLEAYRREKNAQSIDGVPLKL